MSNLTSTFSAEASTATTEALLGASLFLMGADTRRGMDVKTQQALATVVAHAPSHPQREDYVKRYRKAAGEGAHGGGQHAPSSSCYSGNK
ncbi:MAG: hypothetical protein KGL10_09655 [Alphaproteobacteria bacterium]|nr:hypothetical protein [Alphaproteobacteria bacterium]MDE2337563.1 hypothetical protein [Alphaproteobacteria bacterium]